MGYLDRNVDDIIKDCEDISKNFRNDNYYYPYLSGRLISVIKTLHRDGLHWMKKSLKQSDKLIGLHCDLSSYHDSGKIPDEVWNEIKGYFKGV